MLAAKGFGPHPLQACVITTPTRQVLVGGEPRGAVPPPELQHTRPEAPSDRVCRGSPSNASLTGAITRLSPTTPTPPDCDALTCHYAPALD